MNESSHNESMNQPLGEKLPDLSIYGYQVSQQLAIHGDGQRITYLAQQLDVDRLVVIKEWRRPEDRSSYPDYATSLPKIKLLQKLDHLNIPRYLHSFTTPTGFCIVREYRAGMSLAELGALPPLDINLIARAVLKILCYLQQLQPMIIHQNIKPENIIINTVKGLEIYLVDFGLPSASITATPGFIPPELLLNRQPTAASDLYSLGVSLICALTDTSTNQAPELLDKNYAPKFQHLLLARTPPKLVKWLEKMVETNYQRRYGNATIARDALSNIPVENTEPRITDIRPFRKSHWIKWGIFGSTFLVIILLMRQFIFIDTGEKSPSEIAKNLAIAKQAEFEESDRGKLLREKQCIACNLDSQDFKGVELSGSTLSKSNLVRANFSESNLSLTMFQDADLSQANFNKANLRQSAFYGAKLIGTDLSGANLTRAKLVYAKLKGASLRDADLSNADLKFAELQQVDLSNANLSNADLSNADLSYTNLRRVNLTGAKLDGANLTGTTMPDGSIHP